MSFTGRSQPQSPHYGDGESKAVNTWLMLAASTAQFRSLIFLFLRTQSHRQQPKQSLLPCAGLGSRISPCESRPGVIGLPSDAHTIKFTTEVKANHRSPLGVLAKATSSTQLEKNIQRPKFTFCEVVHAGDCGGMLLAERLLSQVTYW